MLSQSGNELEIHNKEIIEIKKAHMLLNVL